MGRRTHSFKEGAYVYHMNYKSIGKILKEMWYENFTEPGYIVVMFWRDKDVKKIYPVNIQVDWYDRSVRECSEEELITAQLEVF